MFIPGIFYTCDPYIFEELIGSISSNTLPYRIRIHLLSWYSYVRKYVSLSDHNCDGRDRGTKNAV